jgi:uncharacterized membrane protein YgdD (TMEM256/DUF423 family)
MNYPYENQYNEIIKLYQIHHDIETVAKMMNDKGVSYSEVKSIVKKFQNSQRKSYLIGAIGSLAMGGIILSVNGLMAMYSDRIFPILTILGGVIFMIGLWCGFRVIFPK